MAKRRPLGMSTENRGAGLEQPAMNPGPMGAGDQTYQARVSRPQPPQLQPIQPAVPGMEGMSGAMPGGGDSSTQDLMQLLMQLKGGYR